MRKCLQHLAIIPDGSGRWAMKRGLDRSEGHQVGLGNLIKIIKGCAQRHIKHLTIFTLSSDNMNRNEAEVTFLLQCAYQFAETQGEFLQKMNIKLLFIGDLENILEKKIAQSIKKIMNDTHSNTGMSLNLMLNYSGKNDIIKTCQRMSQHVLDGEISVESIDEHYFQSQSLLQHSIPIDFCIRTGGEIRISNFCLWHLAYAEFFFEDSLWPDFSLTNLDNAIEEFKIRERRYGKEAKL